MGLPPLKHLGLPPVTVQSAKDDTSPPQSAGLGYLETPQNNAPEPEVAPQE